MRLKKNEILLVGKSGNIFIKRNENGVPVVKAVTFEDACLGGGWVHAHDRQVQLFVTRAILQGRASELLADDPSLVELDRFIRRQTLYPDLAAEKKKLAPHVLERLESYAAGINRRLEENDRCFEFRLLGFRPEPWRVEDSMLLGKVFGYLGLADAQGEMEKLIVQMAQGGLDEARIRELFPYITEKLDIGLLTQVILSPPLVPEAVRWLAAPDFRASNAWAVAGRLTETGMPLLCGDPHLEVNRMPALWHEIVLVSPLDTLRGASLPGLPGILLGRSEHLAWSPTYSYMDMIDYRIEDCAEGKYRRKNRWVPFKERIERIVTKKGREIRETVYENEHGVLEGNPREPGYYLVQCWSARRGCGADDFNGMLDLPGVKTVDEAMKKFKMLDAPSFNFVMADDSGNIGLQMTGRCWKRPRGVSGLVALPGWEEKYDPRGFVRKEDLPSLYNPAGGIIATANDDINLHGKASPINLPMGSYRADRIRQLLQTGGKLNPQYMKDVQYDLFSLQAMLLMDIIRPLLPDTREGRLLAEWTFRYDEYSRAAALFENIYEALLRRVFGDGGLGRDTVDHLMKETRIFADYYSCFDNVLFREKSAWYRGRDREELFREAISEGLAKKPRTYGSTRRIRFGHLLFGGKLPSFLGYDIGPVKLPGNRATITQGQIFKSGGRVTTFAPSYRMVADMKAEHLETNLPGGVTDRRFSRLYDNNMKNWLTKRYNRLGKE